MLLTRAPLYSWDCSHFLVRLACVRHAASVDSEPGSNSRLKPDVDSSDGGLMRSTVPALLSFRAPYLVRLIKPNLITSHDWHVQPICQRSLRAIRLSEAPWIEAWTHSPDRPRTCCAPPIPHFQQQVTAFWRELFKSIKFSISCQAISFAESE